MKYDLIVPRINPNDDSVQVAAWYKQNGQLVKKGEDLVDLSTSKANVVLESEHAGYLRIHCQKGAVIEVGKILATFYDSEEEFEKDQRPTESETSNDTTSFRLSKLAAKLLSENRVDPKTISSNGLVTLRDVQKHLGISTSWAQSTANSAKAGSSNEPPAFLKGLASEYVGKSKEAEIQALTSRSENKLTSSLSITLSGEGLLDKNELFGKSLLPNVVTEIAQLLVQFKKFNSCFFQQRLFFYEDINIGVAMDWGHGLKLPVIKKADKKKYKEIKAQILEFSLSCARNNLSLDDMTGTTFTITDLSAQNIYMFQPIIPEWQAGILGVGGDQDLPGKPISLTLAFDHRILTGMEVAKFLKILKSRLLRSFKI